MNRLVILPDETLEPLAGNLRLRLEAIAREISSENLAALLDPLAAGLMEDLAASTNSDALLWGSADACHSVVWASEAARDLVSRATADCKEGLVARVFESERATFSGEGGFFSHEWTNLARLRGAASVSIACAPVRLAGRVVGVLSLSSTDAEILDAVTGPLGRVAEVFGRLAATRILRDCLGLETS
jgi:hypothetical protein